MKAMNDAAPGEPPLILHQTRVLLRMLLAEPLRHSNGEERESLFEASREGVLDVADALSVVSHENEDRVVEGLLHGQVLEHGEHLLVHELQEVAVVVCETEHKAVSSQHGSHLEMKLKPK